MHFGRKSLNIRIAGEILASNGVCARKVASLAAKERCVTVITHIAS